MLFEGGLYCLGGCFRKACSCDLMLFEGGLYSTPLETLLADGCDLMLFEGVLYYWGCNSFNIKNIFKVFQSFFKKAPIEEVRAAAEWFFYRQKSACR